MFSNPFGKSDEDKKKNKRNKKIKRNSPDTNDESNSLNSSKNDLTEATSPSVSGLVDIVNEMNVNNTETLKIEQKEIVEVKYEERLIEESTLQNIVESIQGRSSEPKEEKNDKIEELSAYEQALAEEKEQEKLWNQEQLDAPKVEEVSAWEQVLDGPEADAETPSASVSESPKEEEVSEAPKVEEVSAWEQVLDGPEADAETPSAPVSETPKEEEVITVSSLKEEIYVNGNSIEQAIAEVEAAIVASSQESVWEKILEDHDQLETLIEQTTGINLEKQKYLNDFKISEACFDLIQQFFNENKDKLDFGLLSNNLLRYLFSNIVNERRELSCISNDDINRALKAIDSNNDEKINLDEFIQLLSLFFSSKNNLKERIEGVLNSQSAIHENKGILSAKEARDFTHFLHEFFGKHDEETVKHTENFLQKILHKFIHRKKKTDHEQEEHEIDYDSFSDEAALQLEELCFVKFD